MTTVMPFTGGSRASGMEVVGRPVLTVAEADPTQRRHSPATHRRAHPAWFLVPGDVLAAAAVMASGATQLAWPTVTTSVVAAGSWPALLALAGVYRSSDPASPDALRRVGLAAVGLAAVLPAVTSTTGYAALLTAALLMVAAVTLRGSARAFADWFGDASTGAVRVVVAGHRRDVNRIIAGLGTSSRPRYDVVSVVTGGAPDLEQICESAARHQADAVLVAPCRHLDAAAVRRLGWRLEGLRTRLMVATPLLDVAPERSRLSYAGPMQLVDIHHSTLRGARRLIKEVAERVAAAVALVLLLPLLALLALLIRLDSDGPALFRQTRVGKDGLPFTIVKFRTMCAGADGSRLALHALQSSGSVLFKLRQDPRTTALGRILRRYSLDELPQLVNVVRGDMSLVGPRPSLPDEVPHFHPDVRRRFAVKPGMTGLWQVSGRSDLSWEESVRLDLWYVDNWSLTHDLSILVRTLRAVVTHRGAY